MKNNKKIQWHKLFNRKSFKYNTLSRDLKNINSYNLAEIIYPELTKKKFLKITNFIIKNISPNKNSKLLDFGSGNGAFLKFLQKKVKKSYSMEISKNFINFQRKILKNTKFILTNPYNVSFFKKIKDNELDLTISCSVFQYFYNDNYCKNILKEMIRTTRRQIFLYDIRDITKKRQHIEKVRKRHKLSKKEFFRKYKNTPLKFYKKSFFKKFFKKNFPKCNLEIIDLPKEATDYKFAFCLKIIK